MINARTLVGTHNILFMTLDTLRYDVAVETLRAGRTPNLAALLPDGGWEARHTPGNFTYAAHQAFFAGFLPTPIAPGHASAPVRRRASPGSETTTEQTFVFDAPDIVDRAWPPRLPHDLHRRRRLLQQAEPARQRAARPVRREPLVAGARRDRSALDRATRCAAPLRRLRGVPRERRAVPVRQRLGDCTSRTASTCPAQRERFTAQRTPRRWPMSIASFRRCSRRSSGAARRSRSSAPTTAPPTARMATSGIASPTRSSGRFPTPSSCFRRVRHDQYCACAAADALPGVRLRLPAQDRVPALLDRQFRSSAAGPSERRDALFLYLHVPFCEMRCGFCNLFTTVNPRGDMTSALPRRTRAPGPARAGRPGLQPALRAAPSAAARPPISTASRSAPPVRPRASRSSAQIRRPSRSRSRHRRRRQISERLRAARERGVDRISLGVQSFVEQEAAAAGRPQTHRRGRGALERSARLGFPTLNIDLIYGIAGQTAESWLREPARRPALPAGGAVSLPALRAPADRPRPPGSCVGRHPRPAHATAQGATFCSTPATSRSRCACSARRMRPRGTARSTAARTTA